MKYKFFKDIKTRNSCCKQMTYFLIIMRTGTEEMNFIFNFTREKDLICPFVKQNISVSVDFSVQTGSSSNILAPK